MEEILKNLIKEALMEVLAEIELNKSSYQEIMSQKELAEYLGVSQAWVSINKDKLCIPYFDAGGSKFIRKDIEKWIEESKNEIDQTRYHKNFMIKVK